MGNTRSLLTAIGRTVIVLDMALLVFGALAYADGTVPEELVIDPLSAMPPESAQSTPIPFDNERWNLIDAEIVDHLGRQSLQGAAILNDADLTDGVIEVDIAVSGARSYPGVVFRFQSETDYERVYVRPHRAGLYPDAVQYMPVINGSETWQLYNGAGYTAFAELPPAEWTHLRLEIRGAQARVFLGDSTDPVLEIHDLKHGLVPGAVGLVGPKNGSAYFSNFRYRADDTLVFSPPPEKEPPPGTLTDWNVSVAIPAARVNRNAYPSFYSILGAGWEPALPEASGLVNISRLRARNGQDPDLVLARTIVESSERQEVDLVFGYSDEVELFHNGRKVFSGNSAYRSRDPSFLGVVGPFDRVHLTLEKGLNEIFLMVTETFGGWGFLARIEGDVSAPIKEPERLIRAWDTEQVFLTPESVLYDPDRDLLYVSSFDMRFAASEEPTGYISKLSPEGEILDLYWAADLNAPTGMAIWEGKLYTTERGVLAEIDLDTGIVANRYPIESSDFLNDLVVGPDGSVYMTDTSPSSPVESRIYRFKDGAIDVWLDTDEIQRANGLWIHDGELLVGNTGDGILKAVDLEHKVVRDIVCLGAGVIDGIRVDSQDNFLVSHWEGQVYVISPDGGIVEVLDTLPQRINSADFEYIRSRNLLVVPTFVDNRVMAYRLEER
jgi:sugar lactone lactonase YvrE